MRNSLIARHLPSSSGKGAWAYIQSSISLISLSLNERIINSFLFVRSFLSLVFAPLFIRLLINVIPFHIFLLSVCTLGRSAAVLPSLSRCPGARRPRSGSAEKQKRIRSGRR